MNRMNITIGLFSSGAQRLEPPLRSCATRIVTITSVDLAGFVYPSAQPPDVLVVDLRPDSALPPSLAAITRHHPDTRVIVVANALDPALMREAMRAGVTECVTEPVTETELQEAIARITADASADALSGQVFAFVGAKGGVGTTTLAINVATELAKLAKGNTLLIDLHAGTTDAALYLGAEPRFTIVDAIENTHRLDEAFFRSLVVRTTSGLDLLAAAPHGQLDLADPARIAAVIETARRQYRYTVVDLAHSDVRALESVDHATNFVIVVSQELAALRTASRLTTTLREKYGKHRLKPVVGRHDQHAEISAEDVERTLGQPVRVFPNEYRRVVGAANSGHPVVLDNHVKLSRSIVTFAHELAGMTATPDRPGKAPGLLERLTPRRVGS
jgi:pilus assembly protein CpaE